MIECLICFDQFYSSQIEKCDFDHNVCHNCINSNLKQKDQYKIQKYIAADDDGKVRFCLEEHDAKYSEIFKCIFCFNPLQTLNHVDGKLIRLFNDDGDFIGCVVDPSEDYSYYLAPILQKIARPFTRFLDKR